MSSVRKYFVTYMWLNFCTLKIGDKKLLNMFLTYSRYRRRKRGKPKKNNTSDSIG